MQNYRL